MLVVLVWFSLKCVIWDGFLRLSHTWGGFHEWIYNIFHNGWIDRRDAFHASSWLSALLLKQNSFSLHKGEFIDAICLRHDFTMSSLPSHCVCGKDFTLSHALSYPYNAFQIIQHNEVRNLNACLMMEVCHDVQVGPHIHSLSGEVMWYHSAVADDNARVDMRASSFFHYRTHFDIRVFNSCAASTRFTTLAAPFHRRETDKRRGYARRVHEVEHGSITLLIASFSDGMGKVATTTYKHLAHLLNQKWSSLCSVAMGWL